MDKDNLKVKTKEFWKKYEYKVMLAVFFVLISGISFQAGILEGRKIDKNPIIIEKPIKSETGEMKGDLVQATSSENQKIPLENQKDSSDVQKFSDKDCAFVGSKNSDKFHLPSCRYAKNIKPENIACFSSENDAKSKGYLPDKNCIK